MTSKPSIMCDPAGLQNMHQTLWLAAVSTIEYRLTIITTPSASNSRPKQVASKLDAADEHPKKKRFPEAQPIDSTEAKRPAHVNRDHQRCCADFRSKQPQPLPWRHVNPTDHEFPASQSTLKEVNSPWSTSWDRGYLLPSHIKRNSELGRDLSSISEKDNAITLHHMTLLQTHFRGS
ncbi:hypothetical protein CSKR_104340 [Clonorchis sinensis]|uniref:Uncharacterized protein n=1 Tax=Clonorchis sinensis TaxID=79923 RepID=A0A419QDR0_CLOSI|nr:hypothetical protein CSKR_104340 [Clonorchis sinensis]